MFITPEDTSAVVALMRNMELYSSASYVKDMSNRIATLEAEAARVRDAALKEAHGEIWKVINRVPLDSSVQGLRVASVILSDLRTTPAQPETEDFGPDDFSSEEEYLEWRKKLRAAQPEPPEDDAA